jgi:hypothetical protein
MFELTLIAATSFVRMWYAVPLIVSISLVYGATRHELMRPILEHALRFAAWIVGFMGVLFVVIWFVSRSL